MSTIFFGITIFCEVNSCLVVTNILEVKKLYLY